MKKKNPYKPLLVKPANNNLCNSASQLQPRKKKCNIHAHCIQQCTNTYMHQPMMHQAPKRSALQCGTAEPDLIWLGIRVTMKFYLHFAFCMLNLCNASQNQICDQFLCATTASWILPDYPSVSLWLRFFTALMKLVTLEMHKSSLIFWMLDLRCILDSPPWSPAGLNSLRCFMPWAMP